MGDKFYYQKHTAGFVILRSGIIKDEKIKGGKIKIEVSN